MKRFAALLLILVVAAFLFGCGAAEIPTQEVAATDVPKQGEVSGSGEEEAMRIAFEETVSYANWTGEEDIFFGALNRGKMAIDIVAHLPIYRFDTKKDLDGFREAFCDKLTMDSGYDEVPSFDEAMEPYADAFFEENSLLLVYVGASSGTYRFSVNSVYRYEEALCVHVEQINDPEVVTDDMAGWFLTAAVAKKDIAECTEFDADLNNLP